MTIKNESGSAETARKELENFGNKKYYYDSIRKSLSYYRASSASERGKGEGSVRQRELERVEDELTAIEETVTVKISGLQSPYNALLYHKFILLLKTSELSQKFSYSTQHIRRLIDKGIELYAEMEEKAD